MLNQTISNINIEKYRDSVSPSIFEEHWWFDAACPNAWDIREVYRDNQLIASFAFHSFKKLGFRYIQMPLLTRTLEPRLFTQGTKAVSRLQNQVSILSELLDKLPAFDRFELCLPPESDLVLPFTMTGFTNTSTFTYRFGAPAEGNPWQEMEQKTRNTVNSAQKHFRIDFHHDLDRYVRLSQRARSANGKDRSDYVAIARLFEACNKRYQTIIITAVNEAQNDVASAILIWDSNVLYYWMSAREPASSGNGANSLLVWKAYEFSYIMGRRFDLDGFITPQNGMFLAKFGAKPHVRSYVSNVNPLWNGLYGIKAMLRPPSDEIIYR